MASFDRPRSEVTPSLPSLPTLLVAMLSLNVCFALEKRLYVCYKSKHKLVNDAFLNVDSVGHALDLFESVDERSVRRVHLPPVLILCVAIWVLRS